MSQTLDPQSGGGRDEEGRQSSPGEVHDAGQAHGGGEPGEFTRMFQALQMEPAADPVQAPAGAAAFSAEPVVPVASPKTSSVFQQEVPVGLAAGARFASPAVVPSQAQQEAGSEGLTQVFQQIKKPASAPPPRTEPVKEVAGGGEFTQVFSAFQAPPPAGSASRSETPARIEVPPPAVSSTAPSATQPPDTGGSFTQMFQQISPAAAAESGMSAGSPQTTEQRPSSTGHEFGMPAPAGSFTEIFSVPSVKHPSSAREGGMEGVGSPPADTQPHAGSSPFSSPPEQASAPASSAGESSFTQMFQALSRTPPAPLHDVSASGGGLVFGNVAPASSREPRGPLAETLPAPSAGVVPPQAAGGGEFTRLMQSLQQPGSPATPIQPQHQNLPVAPVFGELNPAMGGSEFTRVMRGPTGGESGATRGVSVNAPVAPSAPGLAIAPATEKEKPQETGAGKSKRMILLLVILNGVLVVALIILAIVLLHRH